MRFKLFYLRLFLTIVLIIFAFSSSTYLWMKVVVHSEMMRQAIYANRQAMEKVGNVKSTAVCPFGARTLNWDSERGMTASFRMCAIGTTDTCTLYATIEKRAAGWSITSTKLESCGDSISPLDRLWLWQRGDTTD